MSAAMVFLTERIEHRGPALIWAVLAYGAATIGFGLSRSFWLTFACLALVMNAISPSYDFFLYYFTLVMTPMTLLCGVFFPVEQLPPALRAISEILPLYHAISLVRPLVSGMYPTSPLIHAAVLAAYAVAGFYVALVLTRRRLLI